MAEIKQFKTHEIYHNIIKIIGELVNTENIIELVNTFNSSLKTFIPEFFMSAALFDRYEEELKIYTPKTDSRLFLEKNCKLILESEVNSVSSTYDDSSIFSNPATPGGKHFFYERKEIEDGIIGIFFIEFKKTENAQLFNFIIGDIIPQFWSIFIERYQKQKKDEESTLLWSIKDAQLSEEDFLNNIKLNMLLENLLELALRKVGSKFGTILLLNEDTGELEFEPRAVRGKALSVIPEKLPSNQKSIAGIVLKTNEHYICNDTTKDENYYPMFQGVHASLAIPISFQGRCIGVISLESEHKDTFSESDAEQIISLTKTATMFIRRAQLYKETASRGEGIMILGNSESWREVEKRIEKASKTDATVILRGESGTGKELLAHAIHFNSPRKDAPFITLNCAAIPSELLESEMFGHVKGAFTGATHDKIGEFEKAEGGTIFLDEIGDLPLMLQVKLLRVLQSGEVRPVGSNKPPRHVNVRMIAATSRNLEEMIDQGLFRIDMYYRLHVVPIKVPPLREYRDDIPVIVNNFIKEANKKFNTKVIGIKKDALKILMQYDYPGNVRQLRNFIQQAVIMADSAHITQNDLPGDILNIVSSQSPVEKKEVIDQLSNTTKWLQFSGYKEAKESVLSQFNHEYFGWLIKKTNGNMQKTAKMAGISRVALYKLFDKYNISQK